MKFSKVTMTVAMLVASLFSVLSPIPASASFQGGIVNGASAARGSDQPADLFGQTSLFSTITNVMLFLVGSISVIMIIIGGMRYVLSGGEAGNIATAKNTVLYAIVGIVVSLMAYAAVNFVIGSFVDGGVSGGFAGGTPSASSSATSF